MEQELRKEVARPAPEAEAEESSSTSDFGSNAAAQDALPAEPALPSDTALLDILMADGAVSAMVDDWQTGQEQNMASAVRQHAENESFAVDHDPAYQGSDLERSSMRVNPGLASVGKGAAARAGLGDGERVRLRVENARSAWKVYTKELDGGVLWNYWYGSAAGMYRFTLTPENDDDRSGSWTQFASGVSSFRIFPGEKMVGDADVDFDNDQLGQAPAKAEDRPPNPNAIGEELGIPAPAQGDGSGEHGSEDVAYSDYGVHQIWRGVAYAAEGMGLTNAARHMNHYLDNSGAPLIVSPELPLRDDKTYQADFDKVIDEKLAMAHAFVRDNPEDHEQWDFATSRSADHYFYQGNSKDWFFAVGGHQTWHDGWFTYEPAGDGRGTLTIDINLYLYDRYNWDGGKSVQLLHNTPLGGTVADLEITDEQLGALHKKGLAREFEVYGDTHRTVSIPVEPGADYDSGSAPAESEAGEYQGGRADVKREGA